MRRPIAVFVGGLTAQMLAPDAAIAQQQQLERVEVTGSSIRRVDVETASPVQTLTREDIEKSAKGSVAELLQTLSVDNQGSVPTTFGAGFASGGSGISLRGLGAASTLVLVNGRRVAPYGLADDGQKIFTDLNMIPLEAVERVEILKDGGSAIYGSDAIAGVVNVILKKDFKGVIGKASYGRSKYGDGTEKRMSLTTGFGDLATQNFNLIINGEYSQVGPIFNRDRVNRGVIGRQDLRSIGFNETVTTGGGIPASGAGTILGPNSANSAVNGNVRNPADLLYHNRGDLSAATGFTRTFPNAACSNFSNIPQGDPLGGCLTDPPSQYSQVQPSQESYNLFSRLTVGVTQNLQGFAELNLYRNKSIAETTPSTVSGNTGFPGGPVSNAGVALGVANPDNPYFGTAARVRYYAADVGPRVRDVESNFQRFVAGVKGTIGDWDIDTAVLSSQSNVYNVRNNFLQKDAVFALLNPTAANVAAAQQNAAYRALPAGTYWRIAENAYLNSPGVYAAISPAVSNGSKSTTNQIDFKAARDLAQLSGGPLGFAAGAEVRRETAHLDPASGTERGNIIGLGYSAYDGSRTVSAGYLELLAPIVKQVEISAAVRYDHYTDSGNSTTPKVGLKVTPIQQVALRATYSQGFRAPSPAENGKGGLAAFSTAADPVRCALGVPGQVDAKGNCVANAVAIITSPNPDLKPEKSRNWTFGAVLEPIAGTSLAVDYWQIKRKNEINQQTTQAAIAAGSIARDPSTATSTPGDPGVITAVLAKYINSTESKVTGLDADFRQVFSLGDIGKLTFDAKWTHLFKFTRIDGDTETNWAGTHGNCDVTNCIGTPKDRGNFSLTWERGPALVSAILDYRGKLDNKNSQEDANCATTFADGTDAPAGCRIDSFYSIDLSGRYDITKALQIFGSIRNLTDKKPPLDPTTYGAISYNPLDYRGAVGRFFTIGARYRFL